MLRRGAKKERVLEALSMEAEFDRNAVERVADSTGVPEADVWAAGTFYSLIRAPESGSKVCCGLSCHVAGSSDVAARMKERGAPFETVSCLGQCDRAPVVLGSDLEIESSGDRERGISDASDDLPINLAGPQDLSYEALEVARTIGADKVLEELERSGLQGRGGAGFPAHVKWRSVIASHSVERFLVCNADEGEPGTFKDREIMLRQPHKMLEGLAIAAMTIGARRIRIYIRGEFKAERRSVEKAIAEAKDCLEGLEIGVTSGYGAYICGEETALIESIEGSRGSPRLKPPYPTEKGLLGKPTLLHNVETMACVPAIVKRGGDWFRSLGRAEPGTKLYSLSGHVKRPGVYELPLGVSLDELTATAGGFVGAPMAFSPGGASSGFLPISERTTPLDYTSLASIGSMLGSAGVVVLNRGVDMAEAVLVQQRFFEGESCGQCAPCRIGTRYLRAAVAKYLQTGDPGALRHVNEVAWEMREGSICGLGMTAPNPLLTARTHFEEAFGVRTPDASEEI